MTSGGIFYVQRLCLNLNAVFLLQQIVSTRKSNVPLSKVLDIAKVFGQREIAVLRAVTNRNDYNKRN